MRSPPRTRACPAWPNQPRLHAGCAASSDIPVTACCANVVGASYPWQTRRISRPRSEARIGLYPAIEPGLTTSQNLEASIVGSEHAEVAARAQELLADYPPKSAESHDQLGAAQILAGRAERLRRFLTQPFFGAAPWIRWPAKLIPLADTMRGCRAILDGVYDEVPVDDFYMANTIEEVVARRHGRLFID